MFTVDVAFNYIFHVCVCVFSFIPGPWSPCSVSCGIGIQKRTVKCRVFLSFTQTEVDLPDEECGEEKLILQRSCTLEACSKLPDHPQQPQENQNKSSKKNYVWEYRGFTPCSVSCALGKSVINLYLIILMLICFGNF